MAAIKPPMSRIKKRQYMFMAVLFVLVLAAAWAISFFTAKKPPPPAANVSAETTRKNFTDKGSNVDPNQVWKLEETGRLNTMQLELEKVKRDAAAATEKLKAGPDTSKQDNRIKELEEKLKALETKSAAPPANGLPGRGELQGSPPLPGTQEMDDGKSIKGIMRVDMATTGGIAPKTNAPTTRSGSALADSGAKEGMTFIPPASFGRGYLMSGLDAPTGGQAQQNPYPIVISMIDTINMPNQFTSDYRDCRLLAAGAGDISSERAFLRLERMTCIRRDGASIDIAVNGFIADQTGKAGVRGRLVTKQGQILARSLLAGVISGIGKGFAEADYTTSMSALGAVRTTSDDNEAKFKSGIGEGIGNALDRLANYYLEQADKMYPIIEIDAGIPVDVVFTKGFEVPTLH